MRLILVLALLILKGTNVHAATHAIIIGIDNYSGYQKLRGARNDAIDIAARLEGSIDGRIHRLINEQATRSAFDSAWQDVVNNSRPGDVLMFSFSGHGIQDADDAENPDEIDGLDEFLLFQPFDEDSKTGRQNERIRDDELNELFVAAGKKGLIIFYVADACHSGGAVREAPDRVSNGTSLPARFTRFRTKIVKPLSVNLASFTARQDVPENVVFLSATSEIKVVEEVSIDGIPRGALSYSLARALEGSADQNRDGNITAEEIRKYVIPLTVAKAGDRQIPQMTTPKDELVLFHLGNGSPPDLAAVAVPTIRLWVNQNLGSFQPPNGTRIVDNALEADVIWNPAKQTLSNGSGDRLADGVDAGNLSRSLEASRVRAALIDLAAQSDPLGVRLEPDDRLFAKDCRIRFVTDVPSFSAVTAINLSSVGVVQFLYPIRDPNLKINDPLRIADGTPWSFRTKVGEPFGTDNLLLIASERPLHELHRALGNKQKPVSPLALLSLLLEGLSGQKFQIAIKGLFTSKEAQPCTR